MVNRLWLVLAIAVCFASSCRKKEPEPIMRLIPQGMKDYWDFKVGTWWVYQDSATGAVDTVKVEEYRNLEFDGTLSHSAEAARCEYLEILTYNTGDNYHNRYLINSSYSSLDLEKNVVRQGKFGNGNATGTKCFVYPLSPGNATYDSDGFYTDSTIVRQVYSSCWGYDDVVQIDENYNLAEDDQHTRTYWAKQIGIIKKVFVDSGINKTLVSYHIE